MQPQLVLHLWKELAKKKPQCINKKYMLFQKYDGIYGYLENGKIYSRTQRHIPSLKHLNMPNFGDTRVIFEIMVTDVLEFHIMNGILNRKQPCKHPYFKVHDIVVPNDTRPFIERYNDLHKLLQRMYKSDVGMNGMYGMRVAMPIGTSSNPTVWQQAAEKVWSMNGEGIILKRLAAPYSAGKRNYDLMKIKQDVTVDLLVTGLALGKAGGKYQGTLGTLLCTDKNGKEHKMSGMSDKQRHEWWNAPKGTKKRPHPILGRIVEGKAMKKLKDGAFRELRFKAIRHDKNRTEID